MIDGLMLSNSWASEKLVGKVTGDGKGRGLFALRPLRKGEMLVIWGGTIITNGQLLQLPPEASSLCLQVDDSHYLLSDREGPGDWANHSCNPNAGFQGQISLIALRRISAGEEICFDYAFCDSSGYDEFLCSCGADNCRQLITGEDWTNPELQNNYYRYFSTYIQKKIKRFRKVRSTEVRSMRSTGC